MLTRLLLLNILSAIASIQLLAQEPFYLAPGTLSPFGLNAREITALAAEPHHGPGYPQRIISGFPLFAGTRGQGVFAIMPFTTKSSWQARGLSGQTISCVNVQHGGTGPFDGLSVQASALSGADSTREFVATAPFAGAAFPADTSWRPASDDSAKKTLRMVLAMAGGSYSGHDQPVPVLAGGIHGVCRLTVSGIASLPPVSLDSVEVHALARGWTGAGGTLLAGGSLNGNPVIFRSVNDGISWSASSLPATVGKGQVSALAVVTNGQTGMAYAGTSSGLWQSTDGGLTWQTTAFSGPSVEALAVDQLHPLMLFAVSNEFSGFFWSRDGGRNWRLVKSFFNMGSVTSMMVMYPGSADSLLYLFLGTKGNGVWVYRPPRDTTPPPTMPVYYPLAKGNVWDFGGPNYQWLALGDTVLPDGMRYAVRKWTHYNQTFFERQQGDSVFQGNRVLYDLTREQGDVLWFDRNGGDFLSFKGDTTIFGRKLRLWIFQRGWTSESIVDSLGMVEQFESGDFGWTDWTMRGAIIDGIQYGTVTSVEAPYAGGGFSREFRIEQNYPNPFNPSTTIRYALPHRSHVTLVVYNLLGQKVAELVNGDIEAGLHEQKFDGSRMASGVYFYRLQAGGFVQTRKLCLIQ